MSESKLPDWIKVELKNHPELEQNYANVFRILKKSVNPLDLLMRYLKMRFNQDGVEYFDLDAKDLRKDFWTFIHYAIDEY